MDEQTGFPFLELPDVVIRNTFLPLLSVNTLLRLRLVSKEMKIIANAYLQNKAPSKNPIVMIFQGQLNSYVKEDKVMSIPRPRAHLSMKLYTEFDQKPEEDFRTIFASPELKYFTTRYSAQITTINFPWLKLSMQGNLPEFKFCLEFVNLRNLFVHSVYDRDANEEIGTISLPSTFRNLKSFGFSWYHTTTIEQDNVWKFISQLGKLEHFHFPNRVILEDRPITVAAPVDDDDDNNQNEPPEHIGRQLFVTISALERLHKFTETIKWDRNSGLKVVTLDSMQWHQYTSETNVAAQMKLKENWVNFAKVCAQYKIKWKKVDIKWLQILNKQQLHQIAPLILSIHAFKCEDLHGVVFSNVTSLTCADFLEAVRGGILPLTTVLERISGAVFPNLKKLYLTQMQSDEDNDLLAQAWDHFPLLEDLEFGYGCTQHLSNEAFFGREYYPQAERKRFPCFFKLKALKKLKIHLDKDSSCVTDAVFYDVFRHMKLIEFHIIAYGELKSISKYGIRALLTGPFFKANERFSFKDFQLKGMSKQEFSKLAREFPANQIF